MTAENNRAGTQPTMIEQTQHSSEHQNLPEFQGQPEQALLTADAIEKQAAEVTTRLTKILAIMGGTSSNQK